ncbi:hypothetical protein SEVIR_6G063200v4 [Setaria viridis]|uniref:Uncharacterized protein n=2 Tax=Setaria TaxID=4554 RepID=K4APK2_SETIT|nr:uncharacterized protein LOC101778812 [Setaria italica]RCU61675.1 hypothetical protein SETIT_J024300v2 [Setaria italica]TKW09006.1 hypothetical protein SEVIR_6G063200v2 [Setaria viridis]
MTSRIFKIARKSVVIVSDKNDGDAYCTGCVMVKDKNVTVIASAGFVNGRESCLKVVFYDKTELDARVVAVQGSFCLVRTTFHSGCLPLRLLKDEDAVVVPQSTFMFIPQSQKIITRISTYATVETLESYLNIETDLAADSTNYFLVSCDYFGKNHDGTNRLTASPVFTMGGKTAGIVLQDCRLNDNDSGAEVKVTLKARHLHRHLHELMALVDPAARPKRPGKKRKRS